MYVSTSLCKDSNWVSFNPDTVDLLIEVFTLYPVYIFALNPLKKINRKYYLCTKFFVFNRIYYFLVTISLNNILFLLQKTGIILIISYSNDLKSRIMYLSAKIVKLSWILSYFHLLKWIFTFYKKSYNYWWLLKTNS